MKHLFKTVVLTAAAALAVQTAFAQCKGFENFPGGEEEGKKAHVLYRDYIKNENYEAAFENWQQLMDNSPGGHVLHFIDGVKIYQNKIQKTEDDALKAEYTQKIVDLYDQRIECFCAARNDEPLVRSSKAYDMYTLGYDAKKTLEALEKAFAMTGNKTEAYMLAAFADHAIIMFANDELKKAYMQELYAKLMDGIKANESKEEYKQTKEYITEVFKPYEDFIFDCEFFLNKYKPQYEADPNNPEVFRSVLKELLQKRCPKTNPLVAELLTKDSIYVKDQEEKAMAEYLAKNPDKAALKCMSEGDLECAKALFKKALESGEIDNERKATVAFKLGQIYHSEKQYATARSYYQKAADFRSNWGDPFIQIGLMYASSGPLCGSGTGWDSQVVVWPAIDKWSYAKSIDPSVADEANRLIGKYSGFMPSTEDAFQRGHSQGSSYKVGCWIGETTTIRLNKGF